MAVGRRGSYNWSDHSATRPPRMSFLPVRRLKAAAQIADAIRDAIIQGAYRAGDGLPSERDLAEEFAVNRATVREALHRLEAWGLVEIRQGEPTRARDVLAHAGLQVLPALLLPGGRLDAGMLRDLLEIRGMILAWTAGRAARAGGAGRLGEIVEALAAAQGPEERQRLDFDFFLELVALTHNRVLGLLAGAVRAVYAEHGALFAPIYAGDFDPSRHRAVLAAIARRDEGAAAAAMRSWAEAGLAAMEAR